MGIGTRRDPLEANAWYVKAADQGDERAKQRLIAIHAAASGSLEEAQATLGPYRTTQKADLAKLPASKIAGKGETDDRATASGGEGKGKKKWGIF